MSRRARQRAVQGWPMDPDLESDDEDEEEAEQFDDFDPADFDADEAAAKAEDRFIADRDSTASQ